MKPDINTIVVNAGCLMFFPDEQDVTRQNDILDSMLYIQMAATHKYKKYADFAKWKDTWLAAAKKFGWTPKTTVYVSEPLQAHPQVTPWDLASRMLANTLPQSEFTRLEALIRDASLQVPDNPAIAVLAEQVVQIPPGVPEIQDQSLSDEKAQTTLALQVGLVTADGTLILTQLHFNTHQALTSSFLFEVIEREHILSNVDISVYSMQLMDWQYALFREQLDNALKDRRPALVKVLEGKPHVHQQ